MRLSSSLSQRAIWALQAGCGDHCCEGGSCLIIIIIIIIATPPHTTGEALKRSSTTTRRISDSAKEKFGGKSGIPAARQNTRRAMKRRGLNMDDGRRDPTSNFCRFDRTPTLLV